MPFDPAGVGKKGTLFGFPYTEKDADLVIIPVPWEVTASYGHGTENAPEMILNESTQLDFELPGYENPHTYPVALSEFDGRIQQLAASRSIAAEIIQKQEKNEMYGKADLQTVNDACQEMVEIVQRRAEHFLGQGKVVATLGGDHSTPLGLIRALANNEDEFGVLQVDAHMDLRNSYEGFEYSHASIMYHVLQLEPVSKLVQVGIRDYSHQEKELIQSMNGRLLTHFDEDIQKQKWSGTAWTDIAAMMVDPLPESVYISFDMDGLDPSLCPHTGTPVPGGLGYYEAVYLIESVVRSGRKIIGFDLSETGNDVWDSNVASRLLFRLSSATGISRGYL